MGMSKDFYPIKTYTEEDNPIKDMTEYCDIAVQGIIHANDIIIDIGKLVNELNAFSEHILTKKYRKTFKLGQKDAAMVSKYIKKKIESTKLYSSLSTAIFGTCETERFISHAASYASEIVPVNFLLDALNSGKWAAGCLYDNVPEGATLEDIREDTIDKIVQYQTRTGKTEKNIDRDAVKEVLTLKAEVLGIAIKRTNLSFIMRKMLAIIEDTPEDDGVQDNEPNDYVTDDETRKSEDDDTFEF